MTLLITGLLIFMVNHSVRIFAPAWRERFMASYGTNTWKAVYSLFSLVGLVLIVYGYGLSRSNPVFIWTPPLWTRHLTLTLAWLSFVLLAAAHIPRNHLKQKIGHPMYAGIKVWAFAHLIANGRLSEIIMFGAFMIWAVVGFSAGRRRDRAAAITWPAGTLGGTLATVAAGSIAWAVFTWWLHYLLIGVSPVA
jgi:uncharacterized membrane protein